MVGLSDAKVRNKARLPPGESETHFRGSQAADQRLLPLPSCWSMSPTAPQRRFCFACFDPQTTQLGRLEIVCSNLLESLALFVLDLVATLEIRGLMGEGCCSVFFLNSERGMEGVLQSCCCLWLKEDDLYGGSWLWVRIRCGWYLGQG